MAGALTLVAVALTATSCGTKELDSNRVVLSMEASTVNTAQLVISVAADFDTLEQEQAAAQAGTVGQYQLRLDGAWVMIDEDEILTMSGGDAYLWAPEGPHTFELVDQATGATLLTTPAHDVVAGQVNQLVMFGPRATLQHQFFSVAVDVPTGSQRYVALNLVRDQPIEVISCANPPVNAGFTPTAANPTGPTDCVAVSATLGYGQLAIGDVPVAASAPNGDPTGLAVGIYLRVPPTAAIPAPFIGPLNRPLAIWANTGLMSPTDLGPAVYFGAPLFVRPDTTFAEYLF